MISTRISNMWTLLPFCVSFCAFPDCCYQLFLSTLIAGEPISQLKCFIVSAAVMEGFTGKPFYSGSSDVCIEISDDTNPSDEL